MFTITRGKSGKAKSEWATATTDGGVTVNASAQWAKPGVEVNGRITWDEIPAVIELLKAAEAAAPVKAVEDVEDVKAAPAAEAAPQGVDVDAIVAAAVQAALAAVNK